MTRTLFTLPDYIVDMGCGASIHGGEVVTSGWLDDLLTAKENTSGSVTLSYLATGRKFLCPRRGAGAKGWLKVRGATLHNLKNQNIDVPLRGNSSASRASRGVGNPPFFIIFLHRNIVGRWRVVRRRVSSTSPLTGTEYVGRAVS